MFPVERLRQQVSFFDATAAEKFLSPLFVTEIWEDGKFELQCNSTGNITVGKGSIVVFRNHDLNNGLVVQTLYDTIPVHAIQD